MPLRGEAYCGSTGGGLKNSIKGYWGGENISEKNRKRLSVLYSSGEDFISIFFSSARWRVGANKLRKRRNEIAKLIEDSLKRRRRALPGRYEREKRKRVLFFRERIWTKRGP